MRRYLIVANETLAGEPLMEEVKARLSGERARFHVLAPATRHGRGLTWTEGEARSLAEDRLERVMGRFRDLGAEATGEVGDEDPFTAIEDVLREEQFDEIIVSTLPPRLSRWLAMDLPRRIETAFALPVKHVLGESDRATREIALAQVPLFSTIAKRHLQALARASSFVNYREAEAIIREGSSGSDLFVVLDGRAKVVTGSRTVARRAAGEVFGEISVLDPGPRTADVIAEGPTRCLRLSGREFRAAVRANPSLAGNLVQALGRRLREMTGTPPDSSTSGPRSP